MQANNENLDLLCVNTIRTLTIDAVERAKCGHPGAPMGMAPAAYILWKNFLKHNPQNPCWINRDRFVLSAGHASMLLYSLLYLTGYDISLDDIKQFRQHESKTPGHPELGSCPGVETTTGPLGQGFANAVGMAIAQKHLAAHFNKDNYQLFNYNVYVMLGDGDMMEGISSEAASLAGHLNLNNLICIYDNNGTTIEGPTNLAFSENVSNRFLSYNWHTISVDDGNDLDKISQALQQAQNIDKPVLISVKTKIGSGSPNKEGKSSCHGSPLGEEEIKLTKLNLCWEKPEEAFYVPAKVLDICKHSLTKGQEHELKWNELLKGYQNAYPDLYATLLSFISPEINLDWDKILPDFSDNKKMATRVASGKVINSIAPSLPNLIGGSADLAPSNNTYVSTTDDFLPHSYHGKNLHYGVREHAMAAISNGISLLNMLIPYCSTFLVFSDYMRGAIRMSALMNRQVIYIFTHDSIAVGEDGATHQPIEHLASLRTIPGLLVIRPADAAETAIAWKVALLSKNRPTALILTRQNLPMIDRNIYASATGLENGAYILADSGKDLPDVILLATGSEVQLALEARTRLKSANIDARVVSIPCWELFDEQPEAYKQKLLPSQVIARIAIEAGSSMGWEKYTGLNGRIISINNFGCSAPGDLLMQMHGFTAGNIVKTVKELMKTQLIHP